MQDNYCENCAIEKEEGHKCYRKIDSLYFEEVVLDEFFVKCGLCPVATGLGGLVASGWIRLLNTGRTAPHQGYICPGCAVLLGLSL